MTKESICVTLNQKTKSQVEFKVDGGGVINVREFNKKDRLKYHEKLTGGRGFLLLKFAEWLE